MNPKMKIISRASDDHAEIKLKRAGADNVIMPDKIGGTHMAALITKPDVLEFVDYITGKINIRLEEIPYHKLPEKYRNKTISEIEIRKKTGANVIGFKVGNSEYMINPPPETVMIPDAKLFVLGTTEQVVKLFEILKS
jgi:voltage-gated potassium channel